MPQTSTEDQLRTVFRDLGMEPKEILYNEKLEKWKVSVQADGSDDRYIRTTSEIGAGGPTGAAVDNSAVRSMKPMIDETDILAGTIDVIGHESEYIELRIDE